MNGGLTELAYLPDERRGYAFMINSGNGAAFREISGLIRDFQTRDLEAPVIAQGSDITDEHRGLEGFYSTINSRQQSSYFLDRILGIQKVWFEDNKLMRKALLGGEASAYLAMSPTLYKSEESGLLSLSQVVDPLAGKTLHAGTSVLQLVSPLLVYGQLGIVALWGLSIALSIVFLLVWGVRRWRGKIAPGPAIRIRVWPLMAGLSIILFVWVFSLGVSDPFKTLSRPTAISVTIMFATLAFAVFAVLGARAAVIYRKADMNRGTYWFSATSSGLHLVVTLYLVYFGVIGLMTWA